MVKAFWQWKAISVNAVALGVALFQYYVHPIGSTDPQLFALAVALINIAFHAKPSVPVTR